jgi:aminoglycoside phosphotransferase (APT) family kinase protein
VIWNHGRIAAVVDWEDAAVGDPMSDLASARLELLWRYGDAAMEEFTDHYLAVSSADIDSLPFWELYVSAAAADSMANWGLDREIESAMRAKAEGFVARPETRSRAGEGHRGRAPRGYRGGCAHGPGRPLGKRAGPA